MRSAVIAVVVVVASCAAPVVVPAPRSSPNVVVAAPSSSASAAPTTSSSTVEPSVSSVQSVEPTPPPPPPPKPGIVVGKGTRVFLFGDSMVNAGLGQRLEKLVKDRGGIYAENHWSSSTTKTWSESERLPNLLFKHKPDVVFIALGSNEVYYVDKHAEEHIRAIVKKLGERPCVWVGPPVWKKQTGIVDAERQSSPPCAFFDSQTVEMDRQADGIHPSLKGGATWADAVWSATVAP